jgi:2-succinyl-5-enolpyruvyl-6-hydroxy-3-cyclohexene-1-carboxylate synthase
MTSDKKNIVLLTEIFVKKGLKHIVISPGSRNAPIIISFANHPDVEALSIVDERSAGFFALGIAQQTKQTVAIACTSGTAASIMRLQSLRPIIKKFHYLYSLPTDLRI